MLKSTSQDARWPACQCVQVPVQAWYVFLKCNGIATHRKRNRGGNDELVEACKGRGNEDWAVPLTRQQEKPRSEARLRSPHGAPKSQRQRGTFRLILSLTFYQGLGKSTDQRVTAVLNLKFPSHYCFVPLMPLWSGCVGWQWLRHPPGHPPGRRADSESIHRQAAAAVTVMALRPHLENRHPAISRLVPGYRGITRCVTYPGISRYKSGCKSCLGIQKLFGDTKVVGIQKLFFSGVTRYNSI